MTLDKTVYLIIGAKGAGKTHIGGLLESTLSIPFLRVEQRMIEHLASTGETANAIANHGFDLELLWIEESLDKSDELITEATGSSQYLPMFLKRLREKYTLKLIRVICPLDLCLRRIKSRSKAHQLDVLEDEINQINEASHNIELPWALEIDNAGDTKSIDIVQAFEAIRSKSPKQYRS